MMVLGCPPTGGMLMGICVSGYISDSGMLDAIPGTLPTLERSWSLLLEEVFSILFLEFFQSWQEDEVFY